MKDFFSSKKAVYVAVAAVIVAVAAALTAALSSGGAGFASMLSQPFFKPLKSAMTSLVNTLEHAYGYMYRYDEIEAENERLRARIAQLEEEYREYTEVSEENERLRTLLGFTERSDAMDLEPVSVISWTASNFSSSFTISKGSSSGVELHDPVITENGYLVGYVTEVTGGASTVTTIIDTTTSIGALIYGTSDTGVVTGDFDLFKSGQMKLSYLGDGGSVIIGRTVVTSGGGGVYPSGLVLGYIDSVAVDSSGLDPYAVVTPAADIASVSHLYVITDFAVSE